MFAKIHKIKIKYTKTPKQKGSRTSVKLEILPYTVSSSCCLVYLSTVLAVAPLAPLVNTVPWRTPPSADSCLTRL